MNPASALPASFTYVIGIGSNRRHHAYGSPVHMIGAALAALAAEPDLTLLDASHSVASRPIGPSRRLYANAAAVVTSSLLPDALLQRMKWIEKSFGRRVGGQRWRERVLDLDILLWSDGCWGDTDLVVPHASYRERSFVLEPLCALVPTWRDPVSGLTPRQLLHRLRHPVPVDALPPSR